MREDLFAELVESVREGGAVLRGERVSSRVFGFDTETPSGKSPSRGQPPDRAQGLDSEP